MTIGRSESKRRKAQDMRDSDDARTLRAHLMLRGFAIGFIICWMVV